MKTITVVLEDTVYEDLRLLQSTFAASQRQVVSDAIEAYYSAQRGVIQKNVNKIQERVGRK